MIAQVRSEGLSEGVVKRTLDPNKNVGVLFVYISYYWNLFFTVVFTNIQVIDFNYFY